MGACKLGLVWSCRRHLTSCCRWIMFAPMVVLSGAFGPRETFPSALRVVGDWLPLTHSYDLLTYLWLGGTWEVETTIGTPIWVSFAYLGGIAAVCVAASVRLFRWD